MQTTFLTTEADRTGTSITAQDEILRVAAIFAGSDAPGSDCLTVRDHNMIAANIDYDIQTARLIAYAS